MHPPARKDFLWRLLCSISTELEPAMFSKGLLRCLAYCCYGVMLSGCAPGLNLSHTSPCQDGSRRCAAAHAPKGMRSVYKGYRMIKAQWMNTMNRESRASDIGVKAQWAPMTEYH